MSHKVNQLEKKLDDFLRLENADEFASKAEVSAEEIQEDLRSMHKEGLLFSILLFLYCVLDRL